MREKHREGKEGCVCLPLSCTSHVDMLAFSLKAGVITGTDCLLISGVYLFQLTMISVYLLAGVQRWSNLTHGHIRVHTRSNVPPLSDLVWCLPPLVKQPVQQRSSTAELEHHQSTAAFSSEPVLVVGFGSAFANWKYRLLKSLGNNSRPTSLFLLAHEPRDYTRHIPQSFFDICPIAYYSFVYILSVWLNRN